MKSAILFTEQGVIIVLHYIIFDCSFNWFIAVAMDYFSMQVRSRIEFISND